MAVPSYPLINGIKYDWSCVEITIGQTVFTAVKSLSYKGALEPGEVFGTAAQKIGRTRGQYKPEASFELYKLDYSALIQTLGAGYMEQVFDITVNYSDTSGNIVTDKVIGCRIKSDENSHQVGTDALSVKVDLDVMYIIKNGVTPTVNPKGVS